MALETKAGKLKLIEAERGIPLVKLIPSTLEDKGSISRAAAALDVNPNTIRNWLNQNGLEVRFKRVLKVVKAGAK